MPAANDPAKLVGDREMIATRIFDAPRELVFKLWTDPLHIGQWWGPKGFAVTTFEMNVKTGGKWRFVMHGPDGRDYENDITYLEVIPNEKIVFRHGGDKSDPVNHEVTATFEDLGGKTKLTFHMTFPSPNARDYVVKNYGALDGLAQTMDRLGGQVAAKSADEEDFVIARAFDADLKTVFNAWTQPEHLKKWWGPKGVTVTACDMDLRPGGIFHYGMRMPDGKEMWGKWIFREVLAPQRLVFVSMFSDANKGVTAHPWVPNWPRETLSTVTFAEHKGKTTVTIYWTPINATDAERKVFLAGRESMNKGWGGTFEQFAAYLAGR